MTCDDRCGNPQTLQRSSARLVQTRTWSLRARRPGGSAAMGTHNMTIGTEAGVRRRRTHHVGPPCSAPVGKPTSHAPASVTPHALPVAGSIPAGPCGLTAILGMRTTTTRAPSVWTRTGGARVVSLGVCLRKTVCKISMCARSSDCTGADAQV
jgi:hypothetical protein